jgi:hypothetical protein
MILEISMIENEFFEPKKIKVYEVSEILLKPSFARNFFQKFTQKIRLSKYCVVLLDENLLHYIRFSCIG